MRAYLATANAGKTAELASMFAGSAVELARYDGYRAVEENAPDYAGNALLKASALAIRLAEQGDGAAALADDSGLEVDALGGRPGVYSARFGGETIGWQRRRELLLEALSGVPPERRHARFTCTLVLIEPGGEPVVASGFVAGSIVETPRGDGGFGYDPLFFYPPLNRTFSELSPTQKNAVSHRRAAADALLKLLSGRIRESKRG